MAISVSAVATGSVLTGSTMTSGSITPVVGELLLAFVATRRTGSPRSISGLGQQWIQIADLSNESNNARIGLWRAMPSIEFLPGPVTVALPTTNTVPAVIVVVRFAGVEVGENGALAVEAVINDDGPSTPDNDMVDVLTTLSANAWAVGFGTHRSALFTQPAGQTGISVNNVAGSGSSAASASVWYRLVASPGAVDVGDNNDLNANVNWAMAAVSLKPSTAAPPSAPPSPSPASPGSASVQQILTYSSYPTRPVPSIHAYAPLLSGDDYLLDLTDKVNDYQHDIRAVGGYWSAGMTIRDNMGRLEDWFESGLGRRIVTYSPDATVIWEGFVNRVDLHLGSKTITKGPLLDVANRVRMIFSYIAPGGLDLGVRALTDWAEDTVSQSLYGIIERVLSGPGMTPDTADSLVADYLQEYAEPQIDQDNTGGEPSISLDCLGYAHWLNAYVYNNSGTGVQNLSAKLAAVLAADPNNFISTVTTRIATNALEEPVRENDNRVAWNIIKELTNKGDAADNRHLFGVYADRIPIYAPVVDEIGYIQQVGDPAQRFTTTAGQTIAPWDVQVGRWVLSTDILPGRVTINTALRRDPRAVFIEELTYRIPYEVTIRGGKVRRIDQKLARMGLAGIGG